MSEDRAGLLAGAAPPPMAPPPAYTPSAGHPPAGAARSAGKLPAGAAGSNYGTYNSPAYPQYPAGSAQYPAGSAHYPAGSAQYPAGGAPRQPTYTQQPQHVTVVQSTPQVVMVGGCPACRVGVLEDDFTCLGVLCAIFFFPLGLLCCLLLRQRRCPNCGAIFG